MKGNLDIVDYDRECGVFTIQTNNGYDGLDKYPISDETAIAACKEILHQLFPDAAQDMIEAIGIIADNTSTYENIFDGE